HVCRAALAHHRRLCDPTGAAAGDRRNPSRPVVQRPASHHLERAARRGARRLPPDRFCARHPGGGLMMNRTVLISLQTLVAVVIVVLWHLASTTTLFGNPKTVAFFFGDPVSVMRRIGTWVFEGSIWYH